MRIEPYGWLICKSRNVSRTGNPMSLVAELIYVMTSTASSNYFFSLPYVLSILRTYSCEIMGHLTRGSFFTAFWMFKTNYNPPEYAKEKYKFDFDKLASLLR